MKVNLLVVLSSLLLVLAISACSSADSTESGQANDAESTTAENAATNTTANDPNEMICRRELVTGSNFRREVCMTRAQREEIQRNSQNEIRRNQRSSLDTAPAAAQ